MDGTPLRSGLKYFILPAVSGNGGGVALDRTKTKKCPLSVFQDDYELSKGLSVVFLPVNAKPGYTVQTATDLNIEFTAETACDEATVWKVESYDHDVKQWFIGTGGIEGKPGPRTVDNWFKIAKYGGNYKLMGVVRQIVDHSLVKNTTRILHLHKNLHLSRIDEISLEEIDLLDSRIELNQDDELASS
ncbi:Kunitz trypsin inhibitor 5 [Linum perenne]